jgi:hypothetical protein
MSNISAGTSTTTSLVQTGDLTGNLVLQSNAVSIATVTSTGVLVSGIVSASGNITGGNILTAGVISSTGNITGNNMTAGNIVVVGGFTITAVGTKLVFSYGGSNILSLSSTGNLIASNNITAAGTP